ncbi:MAG: POTRA domain-containing protein, partial [Gammaproteobacteria bacterium]
MLLTFSSWSFADFIVEDIRVEGAQNIETGTIFNYLPIKVGDRADEGLIDQSIKALFSTGFF